MGALSHQDRRREILKAFPQVRDLEGCKATDWWAVTYSISVALAQCCFGALAGSSWGTCLFLALTIGPYLDAVILSIIHEATHFLIIKYPPYNRIFSICVQSVMVMPISEIFRQHHGEHHRALSDPRFDVDIPMPFEVGFVGTSSFWKTMWLSFNMILLPIRSMYKLPVHTDKFLVFNWICCIGFGICVFMTNRLSLAYFVLSTLASQGLHPANARQLQEHLFDGDPKQHDASGPGTYSYYGIANLFTMNVGYHQEHHDFPRVPYSLLPKLREIVGKEYYPDHRSFNLRGVECLVNFIFNPAISLADFGH